MCITDVTQTSRRVLESGLCSPWGGSMSHPGPPSLQLLSLNVNGLRERQKRAALFAVLQAGPWHVIALQETHHATQAEATHWCREGAGPTAHGMAHHFGLLAHQPAAAWPCCSRHVRFCQGSQPMLQTPVADMLPLKAALVATMSPWRQCMLLSKGRSVCLFSSRASFLLCQQAPPYSWGVTGTAWQRTLT